ncbi:BT_3987 domain-containing protein [Pedobacter cryoconitis]|uniref:DUF1735 domain-containing protein n=1 Tax=Pedobacter cryoconitis TaxID=188932 RepID=A0A7X0J003_9SPHI|nr:DUF1735 domain-containing protein [Pedobacter cryoconitis]MBB6498539.1 hypothetical protein [Pedobacter cryoconitis]
MRNNILKWTLPVLCVIGLSSCLKNKNAQPDFSSVTPVVEIPVNAPAGNGGGNSLIASFTVDPALSDYVFYVNYAAPAANANDLKITLAVDPTALATYNTTNSTTLPILPSNGYVVPTTVTIPAGQRKVQVPIKINTSVLDPTLAYALPITITDASGVIISKNFASLILNIVLKNKYDGKYNLKGSILRAGDNVLSGNFKGYSKSLTTFGVNSVQFGQIWADGSNTGGIDGLTLTVDPATNKVKVTSTTNAAVVNLPTYDNRYDPATKTFFVSFYWGTGPTNRAATDTLTYTGPR